MQPTHQRQHEKNDANLLTVFPTHPRLKGAVIEFTALISKSIEGGKVNMQQPPTKSGFFISASMANSTRLLGVVRNRKPTQCGNTCSVSFKTLRDSQQFEYCLSSKYLEEVNAL